MERDGGFVIGEGGLRLLLEVVALGSLLAASREIGWSYRHAWQYLRRAGQALGFALVTPRPGKGARRGTKVTPEGHSVLQMLERARARLDRSAGPSGLTLKEIARSRGLDPARTQTSPRNYPGSCSQRAPKSPKGEDVRSANLLGVVCRALGPVSI